MDFFISWRSFSFIVFKKNSNGMDQSLTKLDSLKSMSYNAHGMKMEVTTMEEKWLSLFVPDKHGKAVDVVLGYDS